MKKYLVLAFTIIAILVFSTVAISACSPTEQTSWDVADSGFKITASLTDDGKYGFILKVDGNGKMRDYASKKDAPWYGKSGRIKGVELSAGITAVGSNAFTDCAVKSVTLPESVKTLGSNSFPEQTQIFAYANVSALDGAKVYVYSESEPQINGYFWHTVNGEKVLWPMNDNTVTKVLFIGNSFTFYSDIPALFGEIAKSAKKNVVVESVTQGSWTLAKFADDKDEYGKVVDEKLKASDDYDAVVLQEQSTKPLNDYSGFLNAAKSLQAKINSTQKSCKIYLYSTWGYKSDADARNMTIPEMELKIREAYDNAAQAMGVKVSYVGKAFSYVFKEYTQYNLYYEDNKHPSYEGAFLSACVHAATVLGIDPRTSTYTGNLDSSVAETLKSVAYTTVYAS